MGKGTIPGSVSLNSSGYSFYIEWTSTPNVQKNTSSVTATAYAKAKTNEWASDTVNSNFTQKITINGDSVSENIRVNIESNMKPVKLISHTVTVNHDQDGSKSITISANCKLGTASYSPGTGTASKSVDLDHIDRTAPTVSFSVSGKTQTSISLSAKANVSCKNWYYSIDGGDSWKLSSETAATSKTISISGLKPSTTYSIQIKAQKVSNLVEGKSVKQNVTTNAGTPGAPSTVTAVSNLDSEYTDGHPIIISWSGASGTITGYQIQYSLRKKGEAAFESWKALANTTSTDSKGTYTDNGHADLPAGTQIRYQVRAANGSYYSSYKISNTLTRLGGTLIKDGDTYRYGTIWARQKGVWKRAACFWVKDNGVWKKSV